MARLENESLAGTRPDDGAAAWRSSCCCAWIACTVLLGALAVVWCDGQVRINRYAEQISTNEREIGAMMAALRDLQTRDKRQDLLNETQREINLSTAKWMVLASEKLNGRQHSTNRRD